LLSNEIKNKILFLWLDTNEFHAQNALRRGIDTRTVYKRIPKFLKAVRRIYVKMKFLPVEPWLESWKNDLNQFELVILHASKLTPPVARYIAKKNARIRLIVWYWNPVSKCVSVDEFSSESSEIWTFDEDDAKTYSLHKNTQYYFKDIEIDRDSIKYDAFFVGSDKGRLSELKAIESVLNDEGLNTYFHIVGSRAKRKKSVYSGERLEYGMVLKYISETRAVVDVVSEKQSGMTLRPLEALFFRKKLITTDKSVANRDFYSPNNIFIIGVDSISNITEFLNLPVCEIDSLFDWYDFDSWLLRFIERPVS
jgi:hypothetical protein